MPAAVLHGGARRSCAVCLTPSPADVIVWVAADNLRGATVFFHTTRAVSDRTDYRKEPDGTWKAEFDGAIHVVATGSSLEDCRFRMFDALDARLAQFVCAPPDRGDGA